MDLSSRTVRSRRPVEGREIDGRHDDMIDGSKVA